MKKVSVKKSKLIKFQDLKLDKSKQKQLKGGTGSTVGVQDIVDC